MAPGAIIDSNHSTSDLQVKSEGVNLRTVDPPFEIEEHPIDEYPPVRAIVVGAGIAGITAAVLLPAKVPNLDLVIYERNNDIVCLENSVLNLLAR